MTGPRGPSGEIRLVNCVTTTKTVVQHGRRHKVRSQTCTTRTITGTATFNTSARAVLARGHRIYATGEEERGRVLLHDLRSIPAGRYLLALTSRVDGRARVLRLTVTLP